MPDFADDLRRMRRGNELTARKCGREVANDGSAAMRGVGASQFRRSTQQLLLPRPGCPFRDWLGRDGVPSQEPAPKHPARHRTNASRQWCCLPGQSEVPDRYRQLGDLNNLGETSEPYPPTPSASWPPKHVQTVETPEHASRPRFRQGATPGWLAHVRMQHACRQQPHACSVPALTEPHV